MLRGKASMRISISRRDPITDEKPCRAAMQASSSLGSSSRTWFSTGIRSVDIFRPFAIYLLSGWVRAYTPR